MPEPSTQARELDALTARQHALLIAVSLVGLLFRAVYLQQQAAGNPLFDSPIMDCKMHVAWAGRIASGEGLGELPFFRAPLYYYLLALLFKIAGPSVLLAKVVGITMGAATTYLIARLGTLIGGFRVGLVAGILAAVYWPFVYFDSHLLTVGLETFLDVLFLLLLLVATRRCSNIWFLAAGIVWGLSAIVRPNVLALTPGIVAWLWFALDATPRFKRFFLATAALGLGGCLAVLPVTVRNYVVGGEVILVASNGGVNFFIGNNKDSDGFTAVVPGTRPGWQEGFEDTHRIVEQHLGRPPTESEVSDYYYDRGWEWIAANPGDWLRHLFKKLRLFFIPIEIPNNAPIWFFAGMAKISILFWIGFPVVAVLGFAGLVLMESERRWRWLLLVFFLLYMLTVVMFFCSGRYRIPVMPVLMITAASGLVALPKVWRARQIGRLVSYLLVAAATGGFLASSISALEIKSTGQAEDFDSYAASMGHHILAVHHHLKAADSPAEFDLAVNHYREAFLLRPHDPELAHRLGLVLRATPGGDAKVIEIFKSALPRAAMNPNLLSQLGQSLCRENLYAQAVPLLEQAIPLYREAGRMFPPTELTVSLARSLGGIGRFGQAHRLLTHSLVQQPDEPLLAIELAWNLATNPVDRLRNGAEALRFAEAALQSDRSRGVESPAMVHDTKGAALAETGDFEGAKQSARIAAARARRQGDDRLAKAIDRRWQLYREGKPYRQGQ